MAWPCATDAVEKTFDPEADDMLLTTSLYRPMYLKRCQRILVTLQGRPHGHFDAGCATLENDGIHCVLRRNARSIDDANNMSLSSNKGNEHISWASFGPCSPAAFRRLLVQTTPPAVQLGAHAPERLTMLCTRKFSMLKFCVV
jgi:hypothetical protein